VEEEYISDDFNLTGLRSLVAHYDVALDIILDTDTDEPTSALSDHQHQQFESAAETLYGLIHARYILTTRGLSVMLEKFKNVAFGRCPRSYCQGQPVLPVGQSDLPRQGTVKIFCPKCQDIYYPKLRRHASIDGAYFGTTFPHLLLQLHPDYDPPRSTLRYVPKIYGFKIHQTAREVALQQLQLQQQQEPQQQQNSNNNSRSKNPERDPDLPL